MLPTEGDLILGLTTTSVTGRRGADLIKFKLPGNLEGTTVHCSQSLQQLRAEDNAVSLASKGGYVAAVSQKKLFILPLNKSDHDVHCWKLTKVDSNYKKREFRCVAAHPKDICVATGLDDGKIILWWNFLGDKKNLVTTIQHWHSLAVCDLCYSPQGSSLLSGGHECVLVRWQHNSNQREFLPRLGAPINRLAISSDNFLYATSHTDNGIQIISSSREVVQVLQGMTRSRWNTRSEKHDAIGLVYDPRSQAVVSNGKPGHIQFYHLERDSQLYNLDIVGHNYISPANLQRPLVSTEVECVAFNQSGAWMATLERRDDRVTSLELRLKFWAFDQQSQQYKLNTTVELPHKKRVVSIKFRPGPDSPMLVSCSMDCTFKTWTLVDDTDIYREGECWSCESVGFYRDLPVTQADFSQDGSLLGLLFDTALTLWEPDTTALCEVLIHPEPVSQVAFCSGSESHLVVTGTGRAVYVWDLMTCSLVWSHAVGVRLLVACPLSPVLAVFTDDNSLLVYKPSSSEPVYEHARVCQQDVTSAIFLSCAPSAGPWWQSKFRLYFTNTDQELLTLVTETEEADSTDKTQEKLQQNLPTNVISQLLSQHARAQVMARPDQHVQRGEPAKQFLTEILKTPAHVLPSVTSLCLPFLDQLLISNSRPSRSRHDSEESDMDEDINEVDSDEDTPRQAPAVKSTQLSVTPTRSSEVDQEMKSLNSNNFNWMLQAK